MRQLLRKLWEDDRGSLQTTEWVFLATILVLGLVPGIIAVRDSLNKILTRAAFAACAGMGSSCCSACSIGFVNADQPSQAISNVCD